MPRHCLDCGAKMACRMHESVVDAAFYSGTGRRTEIRRTWICPECSPDAFRDSWPIDYY